MTVFYESSKYANISSSWRGTVTSLTTAPNADNFKAVSCTMVDTSSSTPSNPSFKSPILSFDISRLI
jgi:hypothetical protein